MCDGTREEELGREPPLEVRPGSCIAGAREDHLQRDCDAKLLVPRLIDGAHAADADEPDDVISVGEVPADRNRRRVADLAH